jgi:hypothetical protein
MGIPDGAIGTYPGRPSGNGISDFGKSLAGKVMGYISSISKDYMLKIASMVNSDKGEYPMITGAPPFIGLIGAANKKLQILQNLDYFSDPRVISALEDADSKGVAIDIIYEPSQQNPEIERIIAGILNNHTNIHLYEVDGLQERLNTESINAHFIVADKNSVGIERIHPYGKMSEIALTKYYRTCLAKICAYEFLKIKHEAIQRNDKIPLIK